MAAGPANEWQASERLAHERLAARLRRRALADFAVLAVACLGATAYADGSHARMRNFLLAAGLAVPTFVIRRGRDLSALARADQWREKAMEGRGLSVGEWQSGAPLKPWGERRDAS